MKVLFDPSGFDQQAFGGVSFYLSECIRNFPPEVTPILGVDETSNVYLADVPFQIPVSKWSFFRFLPGKKFRGKHRLYSFVSTLVSPFLKSSELKNQRLYRKLLAESDFDILHITAAHLYGKDWTSAVGRHPIVVTIHDLIPDKVQHIHRVVNERKRLFPHVTRFIAVSENTKTDLVEEYRIPPDKIDVIYHGSFHVKTIEGFDIGDHENYILFVGGRSGYKNFAFFVRTIAPWLREHPTMRLLCTGKPFERWEKRLLSSLGILSQCEAHYYPTSQMPYLYVHAFAFVYPSRYEGFGIPILDAFAFGCPVILNRASCFPEIGGDAALFFEDGNPESLRMLLCRLESDPKLRRQLQFMGRERVARFSWSKAAMETVQTYRKAIRDFNRSKSCDRRIHDEETK